MCASYLRQAHERRNCFIYDRVIRCRTDLQFCNSDFSINSFLEPNTVCVSPTGNIPPGPNDQFAYGPSGAMAIWASTYKYLHLYHTQGFKLFTGEPLIAHHCKTNNVYIQILRAEKVFTRPYGTPFLPRIEDI